MFAAHLQIIKHNFRLFCPTIKMRLNENWQVFSKPHRADSRRALTQCLVLKELLVSGPRNEQKMPALV
jgi:hypothetical protein